MCLSMWISARATRKKASMKRSHTRLVSEALGARQHDRSTKPRNASFARPRVRKYTFVTPKHGFGMSLVGDVRQEQSRRTWDITPTYAFRL